MDVVDDAGRGLASQARLVGQVVAGELFYRGAVEWGFTGWSVTDLLVRSKPLVRQTSPVLRQDGEARCRAVCARRCSAGASPTVRTRVDASERAHLHSPAGRTT